MPPTHPPQTGQISAPPLSDSVLRYKPCPDSGGLRTGEPRYVDGVTTTDRRYTGQRAEGIGLYDYRARWYDPALGRFAQADTIVPGAGNPMAWDRYAYALNNSLRYVDPGGHAAIDINALLRVQSGLARYSDSEDAQVMLTVGKYAGVVINALTVALFPGTALAKILAGVIAGTVTQSATENFISAPVEQANTVAKMLADAVTHAENGYVGCHFKIYKRCDDYGNCYVANAYLYIEGQDPMELDRRTLDIIYQEFQDENVVIDERVVYVDGSGNEINLPTPNTNDSSNQSSSPIMR